MIFRTETRSRGLRLRKFVRMEGETSLTRFTNAVRRQDHQMVYHVPYRLSSLSISRSSGVIHLLIFSHRRNNNFHQLNLTQEIPLQEELRSSTTKSVRPKEQVRSILATPRRILIRLIRPFSLHQWSVNPEELFLPNRGRKSRRVVQSTTVTRACLRPRRECPHHRVLQGMLLPVRFIGLNQKSEADNRESILVTLISRSRRKLLCLTKIRIRPTSVMEDHNSSPTETGIFPRQQFTIRITSAKTRTHRGDKKETIRESSGIHHVIPTGITSTREILAVNRAITLVTSTDFRMILNIPTVAQVMVTIQVQEVPLIFNLVEIPREMHPIYSLASINQEGEDPTARPEEALTRGHPMAHRKAHLTVHPGGAHHVVHIKVRQEVHLEAHPTVPPALSAHLEAHPMVPLDFSDRQEETHQEEVHREEVHHGIPAEAGAHLIQMIPTGDSIPTWASRLSAELVVNLITHSLIRTLNSPKVRFEVGGRIMLPRVRRFPRHLLLSSTAGARMIVS